MMANCDSISLTVPAGRFAPYRCVLAATIIAAAYLVAGAAIGAGEKPHHKLHATKEAVVPEDETAVYAVEKVRGEENAVKTEITDANTEAQSLASQANRATDSRDETVRQKNKYLNSPDTQKMLSDLDNYRATCSGKTVYGAEIARCESAFASLESRREPHNETMRGYFGQIDDQTNEIKRFQNEAVIANAKVTKLKNYLSWLTATEDKLVSAMSRDCGATNGAATIEELKHRCGNIQFDGARADLPSCQTELCQNFVIYVKPARTPEQAAEDYKKSGAASATPYRALDRSAVPLPAAPDASDALNAKVRANAEAVAARNKAASDTYETDMAHYEAKKAALKAEYAAAMSAYAASVATHQAQLEDLARKAAAERADWEARVQACQKDGTCGR